jgi:hypothetical protein
MEEGAAIDGKVFPVWHPQETFMIEGCLLPRPNLTRTCAAI